MREEGRMSETRNTGISYLYRDGSNYKVDHEVVFAGAITLAGRDRLLGGLLPPDDPDEWGDLIPGQVGLPDLQNTFHRKEIAALEALLAPREGLAPDQIGPTERGRLETLLTDLRGTKPQWREGDDHIYHVITDIHLTEAPPTDPRTIEAFIEEVVRTEWDHEWRPAFYEEMVENYVAARDSEGPETGFA
jgi:hypothetical protein